MKSFIEIKPKTELVVGSEWCFLWISRSQMGIEEALCFSVLHVSVIKWTVDLLPHCYNIHKKFLIADL